MLKIVNNLLGILTMIAQIFLVCFDLFWLFYRKKSRMLIRKFPENIGILLAFVVATVATLGSLFYSQVAKFTPCELCWFQRIYMYPQVIIMGLALLRKDKNIVDYSLALAVIGAIISLYHNYIIYFPSVSAVCGINSGSSCAQLIILSFGYISIPLMALSAFLTIVSLLIWQKYAYRIR